VNKIWRCPKCESGIRAPERLRHIDVRRYCFECSTKTGLLVERTIPSRDAERARAKLLRREHEAKARERDAAKRTAHVQSERGQLEAFARAALKLDAYIGLGWQILDFKIRLARTTPLKTEPRTRIIDGQEVHDTITYGGYRQEQSSGHAYGNNRFVITAGSDPADARATILHEIAHCAAGYNGGAHNDKWRSIFTSATVELTGETPQATGSSYHDLHTAIAGCVQRWLERGETLP
jgi:hypothetical protein